VLFATLDFTGEWADLFYYIDVCYNARQRHTSLDCVTQEAYKQPHYQGHRFGLTPFPQNQGRVYSPAARWASLHEAIDRWRRNGC